MILLILMAQACVLLTQLNLGSWVNADLESQQNGRTKWVVRALALLLGVILFNILRENAVLRSCLRTSCFLHNHALTQVMRTDIQFFERNPLGRILNRFSKDIGLMDDMLPQTWMDSIRCLSSVS